MERERTTPRISVNKLGEYMVATPARRRAIIKDQKKPQNFKVDWYVRAYDPIVKFMTGGARDESMIVSAIERLQAERPKSTHGAQKRARCIEALNAFLSRADTLDLSGLTLTAGDMRTSKLSVSGVDVSVRPEVLVESTIRGEPRIGAFKLYFGKTTPLSAGAGEYVSTVVHQFVRERLASGGTEEPSLCRVLDVFTGTSFVAPRALVRRRHDVNAACEEIASRWAKL